MKKLKLFILLIIILLIINIPVIVNAANLEATITITPDKTTAAPGDTITFTLTLTGVANAQGDVVSSISGKVNYDADVFQDLTPSSNIIMNNNSSEFNTMGSFANNATIGTFSLKVKAASESRGDVNFTLLKASDGRDGAEGIASTANTPFQIRISSTPVTERYTVTFNSNGGTAVASQTVDKNGKVTRPTDPTRSGYTFGGWFKDTGFTNAWDFNTDTVTANTNLYAKWSLNQQPQPQGSYTVTFNVNGGSTVSAQTVLSGGKVTKPTDPTKTGYTFGGWFKDTAFKYAWNFATDTVTSNVTLYAKWTENSEQPSVKKKFTVTFNSNKGTSVASQTIEEGNRVTKPTDPTKSGYKFAGWYKDSAFKTAWNFTTDTVTANTTLYAKWTIDTSWSGKDDGKKDDPTVSPTPIPKTGELTIIITSVVIIVAMGTFGFIKFRGLKDVK